MKLEGIKINPFSLIYLCSEGKVLLLKRLAEKKLLGGKIVGLGGKVENLEDILNSARREFREETGLTLLNPILKGTYTWIDTDFIGISHIIVATEYSGELIESNEGDLGWYEINNLQSIVDLARYQLNFIPMVFQDGYHYNGLALCENDALISYTDTKPYFKERSVA